VPIIWIPFILASLIAGAVCFAIPRLRPYAIESVVAPIAFGPSALLGAGCFEMIAEIRHIAIGAVLNNILVVFISVASGALGAYLAILLVRHFRTRKPMREEGRLGS
jgi:hypothetical protein